MTNLSEHKVLIVEDENDLRDLIFLDMKVKGIDCIAAENGKEALIILESQKIELVVTDISMPEMNGIELLEAIQDRHPEVSSVYFMSANVSLSIKDLIAKGASAFFQKPFKLDSLTETVRNHILFLESQGSRTYQRFNCDFRISLNNESTGTGTAINISRGGMFIASDDIPQMGIDVHFKMSSKMPRFISEGNGVVRWIRSGSGEISPRGFGLEFTQFKTEADEENIYQMINASTTRHPKI